MAKIQRFNPPPGWPTPPPGWRPAPDWRPDPAWGPVPDGWPLWVTERANPRAWGLALLSAAGWTVVLSVVGLVASGGGFSAEAVGEIFGRELVAGIMTGLVAWLGRSRWRTWVYPLVVLAISLGLSVLSTVGKMT